MPLAIISALTLNRVIGRAGGMPWKLPADMKHFKATTMGCPIIVGRSTFETDAGVLPGRLNIVVTRQPNWSAEGVEVAASIDEARSIAAEREPDKDAFIIGGGAIYTAALPIADRLELTTIHAVLEGDTHFPDLPADTFDLARSQHHAADERHAFAMTFQTLTRRSTAPTQNRP
ncbi:MAG: dihydrofolate reductase [Planctomycetota bacterium]